MSSHQISKTIFGLGLIAALSTLPLAHTLAQVSNGPYNFQLSDVGTVEADNEPPDSSDPGNQDFGDVSFDADPNASDTTIPSTATDAEFYIHVKDETGNTEGYTNTVAVTEFEGYLLTNDGTGTLEVDTTSSLNSAGSKWVSDKSHRGCILEYDFDGTDLALTTTSPNCSAPDSDVTRSSNLFDMSAEYGLVLNDSADPLQSGDTGTIDIAVIPVTNIKAKRFAYTLHDGSDANIENGGAFGFTSFTRTGSTNSGTMNAFGFPLGSGSAAVSQQWQFQVDIEALTRPRNYQNVITITNTHPA